MNPDIVRKKRLEELELKKKRLEEMRKSRTNVNETHQLPTEVQNFGSTVNISISKPSIDSSILSDGVISDEQVDIKDRDADDLVNRILHNRNITSTREKLQERVKSFMNVKSTTIFDISPNELVTYEKQSQTDSYESDSDDSQIPKLNTEQRTNTRIHSQILHDVDLLTGNQANNSLGPKKKIFTEDEKKFLLQDSKFLQFFHSTALTMERALEFSDSFDIFKNYSYDFDANSKTQEDPHVMERMISYEEHSLFGRPIMDIKWSLPVPDLFLAAYGLKGSQLSFGKSNSNKLAAQEVSDVRSVDDEHGIVCIWSKDLHKRPERKLSTSSPVLTALFHPYEPHFVVGGCYNGQIVLWDLRNLKSNPIQRSNLSGRSHKHPIYGMSFISNGTIACELVSISVDGVMCNWDISRLNDPISVTHINISAQVLSPKLAGSDELSNLFNNEKSSSIGVDRMTSHLNAINNISCH